MELAWLKTFVDAVETAAGRAWPADDENEASPHRQTLYPRRAEHVIPAGVDGVARADRRQADGRPFRFVSAA